MNQQSLKKEIVFSGKGLFTGENSVVSLRPAPPDSGIRFRRVDLANSNFIPADLAYVSPATRCTQLTSGEASVQTVEHLLAAIHAAGIDNLDIEISGPEVPIFDGSSLPFVEMIESAGVCPQDQKRQVFGLAKPVFWTQGDVHMVALPADEFRVSYTLDYPHSAYLRSQYYSFLVEPKGFKKEIAPCRTFTLFEEMAPLIEKGFLKEANLENGVVIQGDKVLNPEGVRLPSEMVRHKVLDLIGDLKLAMSGALQAHIIAIKSGHAATHAFSQELRRNFVS